MSKLSKSLRALAAWRQTLKVLHSRPTYHVPNTRPCSFCTGHGSIVSLHQSHLLNRARQRTLIRPGYYYTKQILNTSGPLAAHNMKADSCEKLKREHFSVLRQLTSVSTSTPNVVFNPYFDIHIRSFGVWCGVVVVGCVCVRARARARVCVCV